MYDPDTHRHDCALGDVPMMRPEKPKVVGIPVWEDERMPRGIGVPLVIVGKYPPATRESIDECIPPDVPPPLIPPLFSDRYCFAPCADQRAGRPCHCTERIKRTVEREMFELAREQLAKPHNGDPETCPNGIGKPRFCLTCEREQLRYTLHQVECELRGRHCNCDHCDDGA